MVNTVGVVASEGRTFSLFSGITVSERVSSSRVFTIFNFPSSGEQASQARVIVPVKRDSAIDVAQARVFAVFKGRVADPKLRIWTGTLDGHDLIFLRLGDETTLVYDAYSEQWIDWDSKENGAWRPNTGITWNGAQALADTYGSSIIAGDDTFGLLWFLDPDLAWDENPDEARLPQQVDFDRIVTGQVLASGRQYLPCYVLFLDGDNYGLTATDFTPAITLEYSDDQGRNFITADTLFVESDLSVNNPYSWYSLGQISSPGRIFRFTDNGVFTRIDSLEMNDDAG